MDGNSTLNTSTLAESLNAACAVLADFLECESGKITAAQIAALPDYLFNLAVLARWVPKQLGTDEDVPLEEHEVYLGEYTVERALREEFVSLIHETLNDLQPMDWFEIDRLAEESELRRKGLLREPADDGSAGEVGELHEPRPTAKELMDRWRRKTGFSLEELAEQAGISIATLNRIRFGNLPYTKQRKSLKDVAAVMGCDWQDLIPALHR